MENQNNELYKFYPILNFPWYLINKMGQIWCKEHKYVRNYSNQFGYIKDELKIAKEGLVTFSKSNKYNFVTLKGLGYFRLADLMAYTFLPSDFNRRIVNHENKIKDDDKLENLEYVNKSEDNIHNWKTIFRTKESIKKSTKKYKKWYWGLSEEERNKKRLKNKLSSSNPINQILNGKVIKTYNSCKEAEKETGFNNITKFINGQRKSPNGFQWELVNKDKV